MVEKQLIQSKFSIFIYKSEETIYENPPNYLDFAYKTYIFSKLIYKFDFYPSIKSTPPFEFISSDVNEFFIVAYWILIIDYPTV